MKSFDIIRTRIVSHSVGFAFSSYESGSRKLILRHLPKVLHVFDLDADRASKLQTLWTLPSDATTLAFTASNEQDSVAFVSTSNGALFSVSSPFNSPVSLSANNSSKKRKNIGDDSSQPQKKHKSESGQTSRSKQSSTDITLNDSKVLVLDNTFKLTEFQSASKVILPCSKGLIVACDKIVELYSNAGARKSTLSQHAAPVSIVKLISAEKDHTDALSISKPLFTALFGADPTLMKRTVLLIGDESGNLSFRPFSETEVESKPLFNTKSAILNVFGLIWNSNQVKENNTVVVISRSGYINVFSYRNDRLKTKTCQIEGPITFATMDQDNLIFGTLSSVYFVPLTADPQRPDEELWDLIDRTIPIRLPIATDVYNVFAIEPNKRLYGAMATSGYFYSFVIPQTLTNTTELQGDVSQSEVRVKSALEQMTVVSARQTQLRLVEEDVNTQLMGINKALHILQEMKLSSKVIQCKIYPRVAESNGRVTVTLRTELRYSGKFEAYFTQNWFYLLQIRSHDVSNAVESYQIPLLFHNGEMTYDQPLAITSHGTLTVTPTICYHSTLGTTDKLFGVPLLPDGSQRVDTVIDVSIVQPAEDTRASKSEATPTHPSPSLFQSVHYIIHARSSPFDKLITQPRSIIPAIVSFKIGLPFCDDFITCAKSEQNNPLTSSQNNEALAVNSLFSTSKRLLTSLLLIDCFGEEQRTHIKEALRDQAEISLVTGMGDTCQFRAASFLHQLSAPSRAKAGQAEANQIRVYEITAKAVDGPALLATLRASVLTRILSCLKFFEPKWLAQVEKRLAMTDDETSRRAVAELSRVLALSLQQSGAVHKCYEELKTRLLDCREHCNELHRLLSRTQPAASVVSTAAGPRATVVLQQLLTSCFEAYQLTRERVQHYL